MLLGDKIRELHRAFEEVPLNDIPNGLIGDSYFGLKAALREVVREMDDYSSKNTATTL